MHFTYEPNFGDNYHAVHLGFWGTRSRVTNVALTGLVFGTVLALYIASLGLPWYWAAPVGLLAAIAWGVLYAIGVCAGMAAWLSRRQRAMGPAQILVTEDGLERRTGSACVTQDWNGISRVVETERVFILHDSTRPVFAIEKSAVKSGEDLRALRRFLRERKPGIYHDDPAD